MLKSVPALIGPELLASLARMGHGDTILVVDNNYPAYAAGVPVHRLDGISAPAAVEAILTLLPLDDFVTHPMFHMEAADGGGELTPVQQEVVAVAGRVERRDIQSEPVERFEFYKRASGAFAIVATGETRPWGCFGLQKGVIRAI